MSSYQQGLNSSKMSSLFHLTYTRFQIEFSGKTKNLEFKETFERGFSRITDFEDLQYAITVFLNITLYSILKGKAKPDLYLILIPPDLPIELLQQLESEIEAYDFIQLFTWDPSIHHGESIEFIHSLVPQSTKALLLTNLDADDALGTNFINYLRQQALLKLKDNHYIPFWHFGVTGSCGITYAPPSSTQTAMGKISPADPPTWHNKLFNVGRSILVSNHPKSKGLEYWVHSGVTYHFYKDLSSFHSLSAWKTLITSTFQTQPFFKSLFFIMKLSRRRVTFLDDHVNFLECNTKLSSTGTADGTSVFQLKQSTVHNQSQLDGIPINWEGILNL